AVALAHGYYSATLIGPRILFLTVPVFVLIFDLEQGRKDFPGITVNGHGDVLGQGWKKRYNRRVVTWLDSDRRRLGWVVSVAPQMCIQAVGDLVPAPDAGLVPAVEWQRLRTVRPHPRDDLLQFVHGCSPPAVQNASGRVRLHAL